MEPLTTPEELAGYLQREIDRYSAELAVRGASGIIRSICGWDLTRVTETLTVDSNGAAAVKLPTLKINDIMSVTLDGTTVVDTAEYLWSPNGILVARSYWPTGRLIAAEVDHGYEPIPDDVRIIACAIASRLYGNPEGLAMRVAGDSTRTFGQLLSPVEMRIISRYALT